MMTCTFSLPTSKPSDVYLSEKIMDRAKTEMEGTSICAYCSRMKRGALYSCCRKEGYNVLVLAQHLDDLAESFVMSAFHNGQLRTMKANYVELADSGKCPPCSFALQC